MLTLSTNGQNDLRECPERYRLSHDCDGQGSRVRPLVEAVPLRRGLQGHAGLEAWWISSTPLESMGAALKAYVEPDQHLKALVKAMLVGYHVQWFSERSRYKVLGAEVEYALPLIESVNRTGRMDAVVEADGQLYVVEHKFTGGYIRDRVYWAALQLNSQVSNYLDACAELYGRKVAGVIYDVIGVPKLKASDGETPKAYFDRVCLSIMKAPADHYERRTIVRLEHEAARARQDLEGTARQLLMHRATGLWPRNHVACGRYGKDNACSYLPICDGETTANNTKLYKIERKST